jgi:hypothetical protein
MADERALYREVLYWRELLARVAADLEAKAGRERTPRGRIAVAREPYGSGAASMRACLKPADSAHGIYYRIVSGP